MGVIFNFLSFYSTGLPVILKPGQRRVNLVDMNGRTLVPGNDFNFVRGRIDCLQLSLALTKPCRICKKGEKKTYFLLEL